MTPKKDNFTVNTSGVTDLLSDRFRKDAPAQSTGDGKTAQRRNGTTATPPPVPKPSKYTLLLDQDDALALDELALQMRREAGRPVDKAEIMRLLIRLARDHTEVSAFLSQRVRRD